MKLLPHAHNEPSAFSAIPKPPPPDNLVTPVRKPPPGATTCTGLADGCNVASPFPSSPTPFQPQVQAVPSVLTAPETSCSAEICDAPVKKPVPPAPTT